MVASFSQASPNRQATHLPTFRFSLPSPKEDNQRCLILTSLRLYPCLGLTFFFSRKDIELVEPAQAWLIPSLSQQVLLR